MAKKPKSKSYKSPLEKHPKYVRAIGMVTIEHAALELVLAELLGMILDIPLGYGDTLYFTPKSTIARVQLITNLIPDALWYDRPLEKKLSGILKRCNTVMGKRHDVMHSIWGKPDWPNEKVFQMMLPRGDAKMVKLHHLTDIIRDQRNLVDEIIEITETVQASVAQRPLRRIFPERDPRDKPE